MILRQRATALAFFAATIAASLDARADDDGVYGRFDGDLSLRGDVGVGFASGGPAFDASLAALYFESGGLYVHYTDAFGSSSPAVRRSIAAGLRIAPLFIARWASDLERGPAHADLLLDSFAFDLGAFWDQAQQGPFASQPGFEIGLGLALPILPRASGPLIGLRGALRWRALDLDGPRHDTILDRGALLSVTLGWRAILPVHIIDAGDEKKR